MTVALAEAGADVVLTARTAADLEKVAGDVRRAGRPAELGPVAVFLASSASDYVTGAHIVIDGGRLSH